jgi:hypothetical protein
MDHYREKVEGLRDAKKKTQLRGKVVDKVSPRLGEEE